MKAARAEPTPPPFIPVTLTLETQEEVDALCGLMNHVWVAEALIRFSNDHCGQSAVSALGFRVALDPFKSREGSEAAFAACCNTFKSKIS